MSKKSDIKRLEIIAEELAKADGLYAERRKIWKRRMLSGDSTQSELAKVSQVGRAMVNREADKSQNIS